MPYRECILYDVPVMMWGTWVRQLWMECSVDVLGLFYAKWNLPALLLCGFSAWITSHCWKPVLRPSAVPLVGVSISLGLLLLCLTYLAPQILGSYKFSIPKLVSLLLYNNLFYPFLLFRYKVCFIDINVDNPALFTFMLCISLKVQEAFVTYSWVLLFIHSVILCL